MSQFLEGFVLFHAAGRKMDEQFVNCKVLTRCAGQRYPFGEQLVPILTAFVSCLLQDLSPQLSLIRKVCCLGILGIQSSDSLATFLFLGYHWLMFFALMFCFTGERNKPPSSTPCSMRFYCLALFTPWL